ncbi:putative KAT8 regulatory NSL complex subunit 3/Testis-expressed sequence 30 protein [Helianthus debilis subsp. tardiflorus]
MISCSIVVVMSCLEVTYLIQYITFQGSKGAIRDEPLLQLTVPTMFVQGTKDGLCSLESLEAVMKKMKAVSRLHVVENGDHSMKIAKKNLELAGISQEEAEQSAVQAIAMFVSQTVGAM